MKVDVAELLNKFVIEPIGSTYLLVITDKPRAASLLLDALNLEISNAGIIRYQLKQAEKADED